MIRGLNIRATEYIKNILEKKGISLVKSISGYQGDKNELQICTDIENVQPGSAVGIQLSAGDINIVGIGTATCISIRASILASWRCILSIFFCVYIP